MRIIKGVEEIGFFMNARILWYLSAYLVSLSTTPLIGEYLDTWTVCLRKEHILLESRVKRKNIEGIAKSCISATKSSILLTRSGGDGWVLGHFKTPQTWVLDSINCLTIITTLKVEATTQQLSSDLHCGDDLSTRWPGYLNIAGKPNGSPDNMRCGPHCLWKVQSKYPSR